MEKTIEIQTSEGKMEITGEVLIFDNYDEFEFIAHQVPDTLKLWVVTETKTGLMLPQQYHCHTKESAIEQAEIMLLSITQTILRDVVRKSIIRIAYSKDEEITTI